MDAKEPLKMYKMTERDRENFDISIYIVKKNTKIKNIQSRSLFGYDKKGGELGLNIHRSLKKERIFLNMLHVTLP